jgi:uncharacterized protein (UPF0128 family)
MSGEEERDEGERWWDKGEERQVNRKMKEMSTNLKHEETCKNDKPNM